MTSLARTDMDATSASNIPIIGRDFYDRARGRLSLDVPPQDNSSMDGYALRVADASRPDAVLPVSQRIPAGVVGAALQPGTAARIFIDVGNNILGKIEHTFQVAWADIQQQAQATWHAFDIPNMANRGSQFNMAHTLTTHALRCHLNAALVTDNAFVAYALVFATGAFPIFHGAKNALTKKTITFWAQCAIVDGFRLGYFTIAPLTNLLWRS